MEAFTGISLFLETLLAFVIVLHFGMAAVLLGGEMVQVLSSFLSAVSPRVSPGLGENWGQDLPSSLQPSWLLEDELVGASCRCLWAVTLGTGPPCPVSPRPLLPAGKGQGHLFPKPVPSASARVSPCGSWDKPTSVELSHKYATPKTSGACRLTGSLHQAGEPLQCCITAALIVGWKSEAFPVGLQEPLVSFPSDPGSLWHRRDTWHREGGFPFPSLWEMG